MELNSLQHLTTLSVTPRNVIPENFVLSKNMTEYHIHICDCEYPSFPSRLRHPASRTICFIPTEETIRTKVVARNAKIRSVKIEECQNLQDVFQLDGVEDAKKDCLSHLTTLELKYMDALICIWKGPTHHVNLRSLASLTLWVCGSLKSVISPSLAYSLERLEKLDIESCGQLEHIISEKDEDGKETFSKTHSQQACLQNLKEVQIEDCKKLEYVLPMSIAQGLLYLEVLKISDAAQLMQVFGNEDGNIFSYPTELELRDSSKVGYLFSRNCAVVLPSLRHVEIHKCPQLLMHSVVRIPRKVSTNSEQLRVADTESISLEILDLEGCSQLECIISKEDDYDIENEEISLNTPFLPVCFTSLKKIQIVDCNNLKMLLPITVARGLPHLTELHIQASSQLVAIFGSEDQADINNIEEIVLPELLKLHLEQLPSLISFCPKEYHLVFPSLEMLRVKTCPEMTTSFSAAMDAYVHAKSEALTRDTAIGSATTQIIVAPHSNGSDWIRLEGKWMSKEKAEERRRI
ncbi:hypothetical protein GH714_007729 [Hevea brasiliensis]|uniref:Disease resistance protein At4g27190-like leucine-rich repeats domain-containing protein n=1 Tax=Hevea brasiliensis TaxID=3981 RepID=A0A6A6KA76_HEVBR|nr:hypothetical protein GH714_007729 [Hevea brasiliensis]